MTKARSYTSLFALSLATGAASFSTLIGGCNALTGAGDFAIDDDFNKKGDDTAGGDTGAGPGGPGATSGGTTGGGASASGGTTGEPPAELGAAQGVTMNEIAMYQVVKHGLMKNGQPASSSVPLVANRGALIRVFVATDGSYDGSPVTARLHVGEAAPLEATKSVSSSSEGNLESTLNFDVPPDLVTSGMTYRVEIGIAGSTGSAPAAYPASGSEPVQVQSVGSTLKVKLIPVAYGADGSNRLPDISAGQVKLYQDRFYSMYPIPSVEISVHAAVQWNSSVSPNGNGWDSLLNGIANLRESDNTPNDVYYYGIFAPANSFGNFCGGGCVAGLGMIGGATDAYSRVAIGLGFGGTEVTDTAVHEIGHTHGRQHSPCQVSGDPAYPYSNGAIGVWGYDSVQNKLWSPDSADMMGYCFPIWISDWTYSAIFTRIKTVNNAQIIVPPELENRDYEQIAVAEDGTLTWLSPIKLRRPPQGEAQTITLQTSSGTTTEQGDYFPYDHLPGGVLLVRQPAEAPIDSISLQLAGKLLSLSR